MSIINTNKETSNGGSTALCYIHLTMHIIYVYDCIHYNIRFTECRMSFLEKIELGIVLGLDDSSAVMQDNT